MPDETVDPEKGSYHGVYVLLHFNNYDGVYRKEDQADMNEDPDEEDMEGARLENERELHWRIVFEDNNIGADNEK